ncbi:unnamed protein product [Parnassius apollo]|uniref:(apollo) hypothetical protein n=1 Tax=Parnassius apollo TaxID=110799 RepID=A0A8S3W711_PARAO|nr:unnamed protein product [Parnassius apollo]
MPTLMQSMLKLEIATLFAKFEMKIEDSINITPVNSFNSSEASMLQAVEEASMLKGLPELSSSVIDELLHDTQHVQSSEANQDQNISELSELRRCYEEAAEVINNDDG